LYRPVFSPDGRHVAYLAERDRTRILVFDKEESEEYRRGYPYGGRVVFDSGGSARFLALREDEILFVSASLTER
jgi:hypothetical protein